ncbi:C40 family peptidase [Luedemannella helvata]
MTPAMAQADPGDGARPHGAPPSLGVGSPASGQVSTPAAPRTVFPGTQAGIVPPPLKAGVARGPAGGSEPIAEVPLTLANVPQTPVTSPSTQMDPVTLQLIAASSSKERLGEQLKQIDADLALAGPAVTAARLPWQVATAQLAVHRQRARDIAADSYKGALALGPLQGYANDLQELGAMAPAFGQNVDAARKPPGRDSVQFDVERAERLERSTKTAYEAAVKRNEDLIRQRAVVKEQFDRHTKALNVLRDRNKDKLADITKERDTYEEGLGGSYAIGGANNGYEANEKAVDAVRFALRQVGKPYVWAAEGPNAYDCSGLTFAAYRSVDKTIPRVAVWQYAGLTTKVRVENLLPGDLLFFSTDKRDWRQIHHVAMYIGNGKMVHAPTFGDHVRVAPIWWSEYYGAARVLPAKRVAPSAAPTSRPPTSAPPTTTRPPTTPPRTTAPATTRPGSTTSAPPTTTRPTTAPPTTTAPSKTIPPSKTTAPPTTTAQTTAAETSAAETSEEATTAAETSSAAATSAQSRPTE